MLRQRNGVLYESVRVATTLSLPILSPQILANDILLKIAETGQLLTNISSFDLDEAELK